MFNIVFSTQLYKGISYRIYNEICSLCYWTLAWHQMITKAMSGDKDTTVTLFSY